MDDIQNYGYSYNNYIFYLKGAFNPSNELSPAPAKVELELVNLFIKYYLFWNCFFSGFSTDLSELRMVLYSRLL